jgi:hypothetical protein
LSHTLTLVASSFCPLVIKVCCPSHTVVWEGSVCGALVRCPATGKASLRQDLYHVVTSSVLGSLSASLLVVSQLECPVSFFGAASTSAPPYKADSGNHSHCPFWSPFATRGILRGWVFYNPPISGEFPSLLWVEPSTQLSTLSMLYMESLIHIPLKTSFKTAHNAELFAK